MKSGTIALLLILGLLFLLSFYMYFRAEMYNKDIANTVTTKGMNGVGGKEITLSCPPSHKISIYRATYISTDPDDNNFENPDIDGFYSPDGQLANFYNTTTTVDALANDPNIAKLNNLSTAKFTIPKSFANVGNNSILQLVGSYDCVPK